MSDITAMPTNEAPVAKSSSTKKHGSKFTPSKRLYRFPSRGGKTVKKTVESIKALRSVSRLTPAMASAAAYFCNGLSTYNEGDE